MARKAVTRRRAKVEQDHRQEIDARNRTTIDEKELMVDGEQEDEDDEEPSVSFDIASYPSGLTLSVVYEMWNEGDIEVPEFQRNFVWKIQTVFSTDRIVLTGLPVPQVFLR